VHDITTAFPSVTGPAYAPILMGRSPGTVGLPGLRWFDRSRRVGSFPDYSRSYVGHQMRAANGDLAPAIPTIFELVPGSAAAMTIITRGVAPGDRLMSLTPRTALRAAYTHFRGRVDPWLDVDRETASKVVQRARDGRSPFVFAAFMAVDKLSHARGPDDPAIVDALRIIDETVAAVRATRNPPRVWIASDHGHSPVQQHDDLTQVLRARGIRTTAHPWMHTRADAAVMVSGNAMAHVYLELDRRARPFWSALRDRWTGLVECLLSRDSVDLMLLRVDHRVCAVRSRSGGAAVSWNCRTFSYERIEGGDPLAIGRDLRDVSADEAFDATMQTDHPDSIVQIARLVAAERSGDIILSAKRGWDFRDRYEPIPHVSSHGALLRDHMVVPLLVDAPVARVPRRTADVMPSALHLLGVPPPGDLEGRSFF
jgi:hypothetical protein